MENYDKAIDEKKTSLELRKDIEPRDGRMLVIETLEGLSESYDKKNSFEKALTYDLEALRLKLERDTEWQDGTEKSRSEARSYFNIGNIHNKLKDYHKAKENIYKSYEIRDKLYPSKNNPELFLSLYALGDVYEKLGNYKDSERFKKMAFNMKDDLEAGHMKRRFEETEDTLKDDFYYKPDPKLEPIQRTKTYFDDKISEPARSV